MRIFKQASYSPESDFEELKAIVSKTLEVTLISREEAIYSIRKYDLVLLFS